MTKKTSRDIAAKWWSGFLASMVKDAQRSLSESDDWLAGYDVGLLARKSANGKFNDYLRANGMEPMDVRLKPEAED